jgi:hypothetical protein
VIPIFESEVRQYDGLPELLTTPKPVFHFNRIVPKRNKEIRYVSVRYD